MSDQVRELATSPVPVGLLVEYEGMSWSTTPSTTAEESALIVWKSVFPACFISFPGVGFTQHRHRVCISILVPPSPVSTVSLLVPPSSKYPVSPEIPPSLHSLLLCLSFPVLRHWLHSALWLLLAAWIHPGLPVCQLHSGVLSA